MEKIRKKEEKMEYNAKNARNLQKFDKVCVDEIGKI